MKKNLIVLALSMFATITASAQVYDIPPFAQDKFYLGASLSNLDINYSGLKDLSVDFSLKGGYLIEDNMMVYGLIGYGHEGSKFKCDSFTTGLGGRYYFEDNGIFLGVSAKYKHAAKSYNDFLPGVEVGYAFFLNRTLTIEPALYYEQSFKNHGDFSTFGLRVGFGVYLFND